MIWSMTTRVRRWLRERRLAQELLQLDDRELNDLGIGRWQIPAIASGHC